VAASVNLPLASRKPIFDFMSESTATYHRPGMGLLLVGAGLLLGLLAWFLPVNLKSFSPALLQAAGKGTASLANFGRQLVDAEKIGPAGLALAAARSVHDPGADHLAAALKKLEASQPGMVAWGGWDPLLGPIVKLHKSDAPDVSTPVLTFFITDEARDPLRATLADSRSLGVKALLKTRDIEVTGRFVPAKQPGGQPLDAVILLSALLYQGEHFSPELQRAVRALADTAVAKGELGDLEPFYIDLLSLGQRLDWIQLCELLHQTKTVRTVADFAHLARLAPEQLPLIYSAALMSDSADGVARYLIRYGKAGLADLQLAVTNGEGAVRELVTRQVPVNHSPVPAPGPIAALGLLHPWLMLGVKYLAYLLGAFLIFRGLDCWLVLPAAISGLPPMRSGVLAVFFAALVIVATEPFLLKAAPHSEYQFKITLPLLANTPTPTPPTARSSTPHAMNTSTIVSIGIFALLQVFTYIFCLRKLNEISRQPLSPQLKLRLTENEDNLFDSGLYIGMMGTATALVLQVIGVIDSNLLAAYSSNLFGLVCVAFVKIRHVRGFKRKLILEAQTSVPAGPYAS
jgi:hypothetical protein